MAADGVDERSPLLSAPRSGHVTPTAPPYLPESGPGVDGTEVQHAGKMPTLQKNATPVKRSFDPQTSHDPQVENRCPTTLPAPSTTSPSSHCARSAYRSNSRETRRPLSFFITNMAGMLGLRDLDVRTEPCLQEDNKMSVGQHLRTEPNLR
ncbi:uncharacterized protein RBU33_016293 isoform 1-T1 [Hipposideros larvatus]